MAEKKNNHEHDKYFQTTDDIWVERKLGFWKMAAYQQKRFNLL